MLSVQLGLPHMHCEHLMAVQGFVPSIGMSQLTCSSPQLRHLTLSIFWPFGCLTRDGYISLHWSDRVPINKGKCHGEENQVYSIHGVGLNAMSLSAHSYIYSLYSMFATFVMFAICLLCLRAFSQGFAQNQSSRPVRSLNSHGTDT